MRSVVFWIAVVLAATTTGVGLYASALQTSPTTVTGTQTFATPTAPLSPVPDASSVVTQSGAGTDDRTASVSGEAARQDDQGESPQPAVESDDDAEDADEFEDVDEGEEPEDHSGSGHGSDD